MEELLKPLGRTLSTAPLADFVDGDPVFQPDLNGGIEALPIVPVVERCKSIAARIRRRKKSDSGPGSADSSFDRPYCEVTPDPERTGRKLDEEARLRVEILVAAPVEADAGHHLIEMMLRRFGLEDEIQVFREISALSVNRRAGTAGEYRSDPGSLQDFGDGARDGLKRRS
jgi:hypothetical protein